jgi:PKD repeat protein
MKRLKHTVVLKYVLLWVVFSFIVAGQGLVFGKTTENPVLARVEVEGMLENLELPVYAHLQDTAGHDYALVIASETQLKRARARYLILDKRARGAEYFILSMLSKEKRLKADRVPEALLDDGEHIIVRSTVKKAEKYIRSGYEVHKLDDTPMKLDIDRQLLEGFITPTVYNSTIQQMINQVNQTTVETYDGNLSGENPVNIGGSPYTITTRNTNSGTPIDKATQYVYEFMEGLGLAVSYHNWSLSGYSGRNVIGELAGTTQPDEIVLITAHLDCMPSSGTAPGADDNASGSVGVMVSAEILSQYQFYRTIRFVFFTGEEQGLLGSNVYADDVYAAGDNIVAVYNMDMLGYDGTGGPDLRLHTRLTSNPGYPGDLAIANTFIDVVNDYNMTNDLTPILDPDGITQSDHYPFWSNGYSAILGIEEHDFDMTPYYHTSSDTLSTLNLVYFTNFVKASVGTSAHLALLDDGTLIAGFSGSPTSGPAPLTVNFVDQSTGATSWSWDFGDSGTSTQQNPGHTYTTPGVYTVSLTVGNGSGYDTITKTDYITVTPPQAPVADFVADDTNPHTGQNVAFTDTSINVPTSWSWTFAGGTPASSTEQNPVVVYNTVGTYTVSLTATNAVGSDTETKIDYITVTDAPLVYCPSQSSNYSYEYIGNVTVADLVNTSAGSYYTDYTAMTAHVTAGDTVNVSLTPVFPGGTYTEYWRVWIDYNIDGDFDDAGEEVFSDSSSTTVTGTFDVPAIAGGITRMRVSMKYSAYPAPCETFTYGEVEDYSIEITGLGNNPPVAEFSASATNIKEGESVTFTDLSTNNPDAWDWVFNGGTPVTSTQQNPTVTYDSAGTYDVSLTATNAYGSDTETKTGYITVVANQPPVAGFTYITNYLTVNFTDTSSDPDGTIVSWAWDFGDTNTSGTQNPSHTYATAGTYTVSLTVTDNDGATDTFNQDVTVTEMPQLKIFVYDITQTITKKGKNYQSSAVITIRDTDNNPVANAMVFITWSGVVSGSDSGVTAADGTVSFASAKVRSTGPFTITVDNVTHPTLPYDSLLNNETTDTANF